MAGAATSYSHQSPLSALTVARFALLPVVLGSSLVVALMYGTVSIPPGDVLGVLLHKLGLWQGPVGWADSTEYIVWDFRLPHVIAAALVGAALALAGTLFQAVLRNPLADPYVIGTAAGAQVGVTFAVSASVQFVFLGFGTVQLAAFAGALVTVLFVYGLARSAGTTPVVTLLLAGFAVSSFLISATTFIAYASHQLNQILTWTLGGIEVEAWQQLGLITPLILGAAVLTYLLSARLDVMLLGEEQASRLGVRVEVLKLGAIVLASFLTAMAVSLAGIIAFVGLIIPHAARMVYGSGHRGLIPAAALGGSAFLVITDLAARTVLAPAVLPLGVMTAVIGAPFFLHLLRTAKRRYAG